MHRFFVSADCQKGNQVIIDGDQAHHIERVLRLKPGDFITIFDGTGLEYRAILQGRVDGALVAQIQDSFSKENEPLTHITLVQSIAKGDKMDAVVQKATEIGVNTIIPCLTEHTVVRLQGKADQKVQRWQIIAREACKQCQRNLIPEIRPVVELKNILPVIPSQSTVLLYEKADKNGLKEFLKNHRHFKGQEVYIIVGPEGGFAQQEIEAAQSYSIPIVSLGSRILRTETAGIVATSIILYEFDDLG